MSTKIQFARCAAARGDYVVHRGSEWCAYRAGGVMHVCHLSTRSTFRLNTFVPMPSSIYVRKHTLEYFDEGKYKQLPLVHHVCFPDQAMDVCAAMLLMGVEPDVARALAFHDARWSAVADAPVDAALLLLVN